MNSNRKGILCVVAAVGYCVLAGAQIEQCQLEKLAQHLKPSQIRYEEYGKQNKRTVIFVHGLGGDLETWQDEAKALANKYHVVIYDQRGHGKTPPKGDDYSSTTMAGDLAALMDYLHIDKADIVGHSMGARTAMRFAQLFPNRTSTVTLEDMHMMGRNTRLPDKELPEILKKLPAKFNSPEEAMAAVSQYYPAKDSPEEIAENFLRKNGDGTFSFHYFENPNFLYHNQGLQEDLTDALKGTKAPILFLGGDPETGKAVLWGKGVDHIKANKPDALYTVVPEASHGTHVDNPRVFHTALTQFLEGKLQKGPFPGLSSPLMPYEMNYQVLGNANNPESVVLIHDAGGDSGKFKDLATKLAKKYRVLVYDQRGTGMSRGRGYDYSSKVMADDLGALLDELGMKRVSVMGQGLGGKTAIEFAKDNPDRVKSVALYGTQVGSEAMPKVKASPKEISEAVGFIYKNPGAIEEDLGNFFNPEEVKQIMTRYLRRTKKGNYFLSPAFQWEQQARREDLTPALKSLRMPVMLVPSEGKNAQPMVSPNELSSIQRGNASVKAEVPTSERDLESRLSGFFQGVPQ